MYKEAFYVIVNLPTDNKVKNIKLWKQVGIVNKMIYI